MYAFFHHAALPVFGFFNGTFQGNIVFDKIINVIRLSLIMPADACFSIRVTTLSWNGVE
jgi:hypothetical protein